MEHFITGKRGKYCGQMMKSLCMSLVEKFYVLLFCFMPSLYVLIERLNWRGTLQ